MKRLMILVVLTLFAGAAAFAAIQETNLAVSASVTATVSVTAAPLTFSAWSLGGGNVNAQADITVTATKDTTFAITLGNGQNYGAGPDRKVANGADTIAYKIYSDGARTTEWASVAGTGTGAAVAYTAYGTLQSSGANVKSGSYTDLVVVTVTF